MANVSSVPRAKAALLTMMQTAMPVLHAAGGVTWAHPGSNPPKQMAFMSDAEFVSDEVPVIGPGPRYQDETYVIPVWVSILAEGNDAQGAEEQCWTLMGLIESAVRADQSLGGMTGLHWAGVTRKEPRSGVSDGARVAECMMRVVCHARI